MKVSMKQNEDDEITRWLENMTQDELNDVLDRLADIILEKKAGDNKIVFSGVENGLLN